MEEVGQVVVSEYDFNLLLLELKIINENFNILFGLIGFICGFIGVKLVIELIFKGA